MTLLNCVNTALEVTYNHDSAIRVSDVFAKFDRIGSPARFRSLTAPAGFPVAHTLFPGSSASLRVCHSGSADMSSPAIAESLRIVVSKQSFTARAKLMLQLLRHVMQLNIIVSD